MNKRISVSVALAITIIAMTVTFAITWLVSMRTFDKTVSAVTRLQAQYAKLAEIDTYVRGNFYGDIDDDYLFDRVAVGYINGLNDRYSTYYTEKEYSALMAFENGTTVGVGIVFVRDSSTGAFRIMRVYDDSPADRAGILPGGTITRINGEDAKSITSTRQMNTLMRGEPGTDLEIHCNYGPGDDREFNIQRTNYTAPTVESEIVGEYAYIRIYEFSATSYMDFDYAVRMALNDDVKGFVFDLRNNSGGLFRYSYDMIDILCPRGTIAKAEYKNGTRSVLATSDEGGIDLPMVVLVNESTSAAAELFAASVHDMADGRIVGSRTAGRGVLLSSPIRLQDGSAIVVTEAKIYTGSDETFDGTGLTPDVEFESAVDDETFLYIPQPMRDQQIIRAIEVVRTMLRERGLDPGEAIIGAPIETPDPDSSDADSSDTSLIENSEDDENGGGDDGADEENSDEDDGGDSSDSSGSAA